MNPTCCGTTIKVEGHINLINQSGTAVVTVEGCDAASVRVVASSLGVQLPPGPVQPPPVQ
jgi:hypothetical protein